MRRVLDLFHNYAKHCILHVM